MQRVYLLLRNNKQSGPFTLDELVHQGLNFLDLIWIEGKSTGWSYPVEIEALKPYLATDKKTAETETKQLISESSVSQPPYVQTSLSNETGRKIFVSLPNQVPNAIVEKKPANMLAQEKKNVEGPRFTSSIPIEEQETKNATPKTAYNRTIEDIEKDYTTWVYNKKMKAKEFPRQK